MSTPSVEFGAYFYPLTTQCGLRGLRAHQLGSALGTDYLRAPDEFEIIRDAPALFEGHDQPRAYVLSEKTPDTRWDDSEAGSFITQLAVAQRYGLSYFIIDSYTGLRDGKEWTEMARPLENLRTISRAMGLFGFKYARMEALESPRVVMPIPLNGERQAHTRSFIEPGRNYEITPATARFIVDNCAEDWKSRDYLRVVGRPYLSLLAPNLHHLEVDQAQECLAEFVSTIYAYAMERYDEMPYLVGVMRHAKDIERWAIAGVDATTQYANLAIYGPGAEPVQRYADLIDPRTADWKEFDAICAGYDVEFMPVPPVGWDASPRGERGVNYESVKNLHPYGPIVTETTAELFEQMLRRAVEHSLGSLALDRHLITIFAWNEIGEGAALLHRLRENGVIDTSFLEAVRRVRQDYPL